MVDFYAGEFFFNHPTLLFVTLVTSVVSIIVLFVWNIILTILIKKKAAVKSATIKCMNCGCEQISVVKQNGNEGHKTLNVCQKCGYSWEIGK